MNDLRDPNFSEIDLTLAIQLQAQFEEELRVQRLKDEEAVKSLEAKGYKPRTSKKDFSEPEQEKLSISLIDPSWELLDPIPNIYDLFLTFNHQFFWGRLLGVEVRWSPRMTLCAGVCHYEGRGGLCSVRLSVPLLKLRPRKDLIETLLHEMIHAYLFVTHNNTDHDGHGPQFHKHMYRINHVAGTKISVYHSFHDEVAVYRQHVWRCNGPCQKRAPFFGLVKRSMNRAPSPRDLWWKQHSLNCGGTYTKIKQPQDYGVKNKRKVQDTTKSGQDIRTFFPTVGGKKLKAAGTSQPSQSNATSMTSSKSSGVNINGFVKPPSDTSSAGVNQLDVQNASNANVHGFAKGGNLKGSSSGKSSGAKRKGAGGTRVMGSTSVGSKTQVVTGGKRKVDTTTTDKPKPVWEESFTPFSGSGNVLGSSSKATSQTSKLVTDFQKAKASRVQVNKEHKRSESESRNNSQLDTNTETHNNNSYEDLTCCPLCQIPLDPCQFETHISECLGDLEEFDDDAFSFEETSHKQNMTGKAFIEKETSQQQQSHGVKNLSTNTQCGDFKLKNSKSFIEKDTLQERESHGVKNLSPNTQCGDFKPNNTSCRHAPEESLNESVICISDDEEFSPVTNKDFDENPEIVAEALKSLHPCPICDKRFPETEINQHVNDHFQ